MSLPTVRKIRDEDERKAVIEAAVADNDQMQVPSHIIEKNGKIVGGWALANVPLVLVWHKSDAINAKESLYLNNTCRSIMNDRSDAPFVIACNNHSPYMNYMEKLGFKPIWETNLFLSK